MDFLSSLPEWLFDTPINFVLFTLVMLYLLSLMLENVRMNARSVSIICGVEPVCGQLADLLNPECLGKARDAEDILEMALRRNMIMLFIVKNELSGSANGVFTHLQSAYEGNENRNRYARLRYAVFGIGDSLGEDFNALAIELDLRLRKVGAQSVVPMRLFNEATSNGGVEEEFQDFLVAAGITNSSRPQPPPSAELPETSDYDLTESEESDIEHDTEAEDEERTQEIEIVEPVLETEELKANIEEPEAENGTAVAGAEESEVRVKTTSAGTETPKVGIVELAVDISTSVFESVESEAKTEEAGVGAASAQSEISRNGPEVEARPMSSGQEKSETELDEDWEIIKLMSNKDDSS